MLKISVFYFDKQKSFVPKKKYGMLVIKTLKCKISDFLNSNRFFSSQLYSMYYVAYKTKFRRLVGKAFASQDEVSS